MSDRDERHAPGQPSAEPSVAAERAEVTDALLSASRAFVAVAARSLADLDIDVTLTQFRTLVVLAVRGPQRSVDVATELGINPSTGTRMCDRLVRKGLIRRVRGGGDRRVVRLTLTSAGRDLVAEVSRRRRDELTRLVGAIPPSRYAELIEALGGIADVDGEPREHYWWMAWHEADDEESRGDG